MPAKKSIKKQIAADDSASILHSISGCDSRGVEHSIHIRASTIADYRDLITGLQNEIMSLSAPVRRNQQSNRRDEPQRNIQNGNGTALKCPRCDSGLWDNRKQAPPRNKPSFRCKKCNATFESVEELKKIETEVPHVE